MALDGAKASLWGSVRRVGSDSANTPSPPRQVAHGANETQYQQCHAIAPPSMEETARFSDCRSYPATPRLWPTRRSGGAAVAPLAWVGTVGRAVRWLGGAEGGGGGGWGSISARVPYLGTPLTHSAQNQRTVSPITPTPQLTKPAEAPTFPPCHWIPSHQPHRDAPV